MSTKKGLILINELEELITDKRVHNILEWVMLGGYSSRSKKTLRKGRESRVYKYNNGVISVTGRRVKNPDKLLKKRIISHSVNISTEKDSTVIKVDVSLKKFNIYITIR